MVAMESVTMTIYEETNIKNLSKIYFYNIFYIINIFISKIYLLFVIIEGLS